MARGEARRKSWVQTLQAPAMPQVAQGTWQREQQRLDVGTPHEYSPKIAVSMPRRSTRLFFAVIPSLEATQSVTVPRANHERVRYVRARDGFATFLFVNSLEVLVDSSRRAVHCPVSAVVDYLNDRSGRKRAL